MKKKTNIKKQKKRSVKAPKPEKNREGMNIKQMVVRSAIRQGFRVFELGLIAVGGALMGVKISF